jgi:hypothetical protein
VFAHVVHDTLRMIEAGSASSLAAAPARIALQPAPG